MISTEGGEIRFHKPAVYQLTADSGPRTKRHSIEGRYVLRAGNQVGFEVANYDKSLPLVIDPILTYATYLGGSGDDYGADIALDASGNVYLTGATLSADFPLANALDSTRGSGNGDDAFVVKMDPTMSSLVYSTYLGGSMSAGSQLATGDDHSNAIAVDADGNAYVTGSTESIDFPTTGGPSKPD